jgi:hypothetical protein
MTVPIKQTNGLSLQPLSRTGISRVFVDDPSCKSQLSWDRFVRLHATAQAIAPSSTKTVLDVGGFDGALAFFLDGTEVDVVDPATTGGSIVEIPADEGSYDAVCAVDVLEHVEPSLRAQALGEVARVARQQVVLNYPRRESKEAQQLMLKLTNNDLIREHVEWELPDTDWVLAELGKHGFSGGVTQHTSIAIWLGQYAVQNLAPQAADQLNAYLVDNFATEATPTPLYDLVVCQRR